MIWWWKIWYFWSHLQRLMIRPSRTKFTLIYSCHRVTIFFTILWKTHPFISVWFKPFARFKVFCFEVKYTIFTWTKSFRPLGLIAENSADTSFSLYVNIFTPKQVRKHFKLFAYQISDILIVYFRVEVFFRPLPLHKEQITVIKYPSFPRETTVPRGYSILWYAAHL